MERRLISTLFVKMLPSALKNSEDKQEITEETERLSGCLILGSLIEL